MLRLRPIVVDADGTVLGGNMRYRALVANGETEISDECVVRADTLTEEQKRRFIVEDNAAFGEWDVDALLEQYTREELDDFGVDVDALLASLEEERKDEPQGENAYTTKIEIPTYMPTMEEAPPFSDCVDDGKVKSLMEEIDSADGITEEEKGFLRQAAQRHLRFNFANIAEVYVHASPEMQRLMERSALVLIDFDNAIAEGYVELRKEIDDLAIHSGGAE